jgi:hypothetical protein
MHLLPEYIESSARGARTKEQDDPDASFLHHHLVPPLDCLHRGIAIVVAIRLDISIVETAATVVVLSVCHHVHRFRLVVLCEPLGLVVPIGIPEGATASRSGPKNRLPCLSITSVIKRRRLVVLFVFRGESGMR